MPPENRFLLDVSTAIYETQFSDLFMRHSQRASQAAVGGADPRHCGERCRKRSANPEYPTAAEILRPMSQSLRSLSSRLCSDNCAGRQGLWRSFQDHIVPLDDLSEDGVFAGEPVGVRDSQEKLTSIGVRARVGHRQLARFVEFVRRTFRLIFELITRTAEAGFPWDRRLES